MQQRRVEAVRELRRQDRPNIDQVLTQMRKAQADSKLPAECATTGHGQEVHLLALMLVALSRGRQLRRDLPGELRLHNLNDQSPGAGVRASRLRAGSTPCACGEAGPARQLNITVPEIVDASRSRTRSTRPARWRRARAGGPGVHLSIRAGPLETRRSSRGSCCGPTRTARWCG